MKPKNIKKAMETKQILCFCFQLKVQSFVYLNVPWTEIQFLSREQVA